MAGYYPLSTRDNGRMWQPVQPGDSRTNRILLTLGLGTLLLLGGLVAIYGVTGPASAQVQVGDLQVTAVNETVDGVSDVRLSGTLDYEINVPDADLRVIELKAGPTEDNLGVVTFDHEGSPSGTGSGTITLEGSLFDSDEFGAADLEPAMAETSETAVVVAATVRVERETGDVVTETVTETTTLTLHDSTELTADVGGSVEIDVVES